MIDLEYSTGIAEMPAPGRYIISMKINGIWQIVLEKSISISGKGQNHLPIFFLRRFNIPFMDFEASLDKRHNEVIFNYGNGLFLDRLRKQKNKSEWIGKFYWRKNFLTFFILRRK